MSTPGISMASPRRLGAWRTVRDKKSEIVSITTTAPTRAPEPGSAAGAGINLTA